MNKPVVSVAMVVCNVERFLAEAIESILGQTYRDFEFVIVDFGSTDRSKEIIAGYAAKDSRVKLHEIPHCGLAEARNVGCFMAQGQYIAIMDADDVSLPERLMLQVEFMEKHPRVGVLGGAVDWMDGTGKFMRSPFATLEPATSDCEIRSILPTRNVFCQPSVMIRKEAFALAGGYRGAFAPAEDYDLWLRISEHFEMANLEQVILKYRIHPHQVSVRKHKQQNLSTLAALASATSRRNGNPDPWNAVAKITPELLIELGISEAAQQSSFATGYMGWIKIMSAAGEWSTALHTGIEMLKSSDWKFLEKQTRADMYLKVAALYWKNNRFLMSAITLGQAVKTQPMATGRRLKPFLHRLRQA